MKPFWFDIEADLKSTIGIARPNAQGQAITKIDIAIFNARKASWLKIINLIKKVIKLIIRTVGTKNWVILSILFWTDGLVVWALNIISSITLKVVSPLIFETLILISPVRLTVPAITWLSTFLSTGIDSPVIILSSTVDTPDWTCPSSGITSPGKTTISSSLEISSIFFIT